MRVLVRASTDTTLLDGLECQLVTGDLNDHDSLRRAVSGCRQVFHCAADYRLWSLDPQQLYRTNVEGTRALLAACRQEGVEAVVYTSSVATLGIPKGASGTETTPVSLHDMVGHYKRSKYLAEEVAREFAAGGYPVYMVNPSAPVGPGDSKPTQTGKIITDFLNGKMPAYVDTGLNLVPVEDVAEGHLLVLERGRPGEPYILGGENMSLKEILQLLARITGRPAPRLRMPLAVAEVVAQVDTFFEGTLLKRHPQVPLEGVRMARKKMYFDSSKARAQLDFRPGSAEQALRRAVNWFLERGYAA